MALPLAKLTLLVGAGIVGSVFATEGRMPSVSDLMSGAFKIARHLKLNDSTATVSKPQNNSLLAQVDSLRHELQMLSLNRPVTIITSNGTGTAKYGTIVVVVVVVGYGYVWWKGWKLPDMMFATRRSLSDACTSIAQQLETVYGSIRSTRRELSSNIDRVDSSLDTVAELTANTQERVIELREDSQRIGYDVRYVRDAVETLEQKISRIEGKQELTNLGVKQLCDYAYSLENNSLEEDQAPSSSSLLTFSSKLASLPSPSSEPSSTPSVSNGSAEVPRLPLSAASNSSQQGRNGISEGAEVSNSTGIFSGISTPENTNGVSNGSGWFRLLRTRSATNGVSQQPGSGGQQS